MGPRDLLGHVLAPFRLAASNGPGSWRANATETTAARRRPPATGRRRARPNAPSRQPSGTPALQQGCAKNSHRTRLGLSETVVTDRGLMRLTGLQVKLEDHFGVLTHVTLT